MTQTTDGFVAVAKVGEIPEGDVKVVRVEDLPIAIFHLDGKYYAMDDVCTHDGGPLAEGVIEGDEIECPRHGARFSVKTGEALCMPATSAVPTYAVKVEGDEIKVGLGVSDDRLNPHTGQPVPEDPTPQGGAAQPSGESAAATEAGKASAVAPTSADSAASGDSAAPTQLELAVRAALESVMDPEINLSVIELGLIREVHILPEKTHVRMMLTTPFCPYAPQLVEEVKNATLTVRTKPVDVELMPDAWSPDMMPDPGLLGYSF